MDAKQVLRWLVPILARGLAWILAAKLGVEAAEADSLGVQSAEAIAAVVLVAMSLWTSVKGRQKLLYADPTLPRH